MTEIVSPLREVTGLADGAKTWTAFVRKRGKDIEHLFVACCGCGSPTMRQKVLRMERKDFDELSRIRNGTRMDTVIGLIGGSTPVWAFIPAVFASVTTAKLLWSEYDPTTVYQIARYYGIGTYVVILLIGITTLLTYQYRRERECKKAQMEILSKYGITKKSDVILGPADLLPKFTGWIALPKE